VGAPVSALGVAELVGRVEKALVGGAHATGRFTIQYGERTFSAHTSRPRSGESAVLLALRDTTQLAEERDANRAVLAATADGLVLLAPDDTVTYANPAALEMLRTTPRKLVGKRVVVEDLLQLEEAEPKLEPRRCRDVRDCKMTDCPAYNAEDLRCWLISGTRCGPDGEPDTFADKRDECLACDFHADYADMFDVLEDTEPAEVELTHDDRELVVKVP